MDYNISTNDIQIIDSYQVEKKYFNIILNDIKSEITEEKLDCIVLENRSFLSCKLEWATHNFLYKLNIKRSSTKDVDLNYPQKWYYKILYFICGCISYIFID